MTLSPSCCTPGIRWGALRCESSHHKGTTGCKAPIRRGAAALRERFSGRCLFLISQGPVFCKRWAIQLVLTQCASFEKRPPVSVGLYYLFSCHVHPRLYEEMLKILIFPVKIALGWHFREVFLSCAPMRRQSEKLSMGAQNELTCRKCQQSEKSTVFCQETERIQKKHGCTQSENWCHSPTPGNAHGQGGPLRGSSGKDGPKDF